MNKQTLIFKSIFKQSDYSLSRYKLKLLGDLRLHIWMKPYRELHSMVRSYKRVQKSSFWSSTIIFLKNSLCSFLLLLFIHSKTQCDLSFIYDSSTICPKVGNRIIKKRIHVRIEHVLPSRCTEEFRLRKQNNDKLKAEAKACGKRISTKRQPAGPKPGFMVEGTTLETVTPIPYDVVNDLKGGYWVYDLDNCVLCFITLCFWYCFTLFFVWLF